MSSSKNANELIFSIYILLYSGDDLGTINFIEKLLINSIGNTKKLHLTEGQLVEAEIMIIRLFLVGFP